jgi:hypothetical protein
VRLGFHRKTGDKVAIKVINKKKLATSYRRKEREKREKELRAEQKRQEKRKVWLWLDKVAYCCPIDTLEIFMCMSEIGACPLAALRFASWAAAM